MPVFASVALRRTTLRLRAPAALQSRRTLFAYAATSQERPVSLVEAAVRDEERRQRDQLVLIPSESICLPETALASGSAFGNLYCEGQPALRLCRNSEALSKDAALFDAWHRRLSDGRFYQGCGVADRVELLAKRYVAEAFARLSGSPDADHIYANVQALSGGPANLCIYEALLKHGDSMLTLNLSHGGHLSHGSPFNVSGKLYHATQYSVDPKTRKVNYDNVAQMARECKPRMIVAGASAYPWDWDWTRLREIADEVGAYLHADVCHPAGMIIGGHLRNPLPYADTVMFTTHKTLMGPRGSVIVTKCRDLARRIDNAVFPGFQGGPHLDTIAGIARQFEVIVTRFEEFSDLQGRIIDNAQVFANALRAEGFDLEFQGTENHLMLIDLKSFVVKDGNRLDGETAARLLENVGIICNKNTLPGDATAANSTGVRVATPWITQRGIEPQQIEKLAHIMAKLLRSATGFQVWAPSGDERCRARVPYDVLKECQAEVLAIARSLPYPKLEDNAAELQPLASAVSVAGHTGLLVRGEKARLGLDQALTCDVLSLKHGDVACGKLLLPSGEELATVAVADLGRFDHPGCGANGEERLAIFAPADKVEAVHHWLVSISDGYVELVPNDPYSKVDGPVAVQPLTKEDIPAGVSEKIQTGLPKPKVDIAKPFYIGQHATVSSDAAPALPAFKWEPSKSEPKHTVLHDWHVQNGGDMVDFGGWDMPVKYETSIATEHRAVRAAAAVFDVSHMSAVAVQGPHALAFLEMTMANTAARLVNNEAQYSYMLGSNGVAYDDAYVYRLGPENFVVVFNAGNYERDIAWFNAVNEGAVCIDEALPFKRAQGRAIITPLRHAGPDSLLDIALQGPNSLELVKRLTDKADQAELNNGKLNDIHHVRINSIPVMAARTGYTGEEVGFELFMHPDDTLAVWETLLDAGKELGVVPAGLGARDSARIEAGFPLFGHELEGPEELSLTEADYGYVSRFHRPYYVGRKPYIDRTHPRRKRLVRLAGSGRRTAREGHTISTEDGESPIGNVTSFAFSDDDFNFRVIAAVDATANVKPGDVVYGQRRGKGAKVPLTVLTRFPTPEEKAAWRQKYRSSSP